MTSILRRGHCSWSFNSFGNDFGFRNSYIKNIAFFLREGFTWGTGSCRMEALTYSIWNLQELFSTWHGNTSHRLRLQRWFYVTFKLVWRFRLEFTLESTSCYVKFVLMQPVHMNFKYTSCVSFPRNGFAVWKQGTMTFYCKFSKSGEEIRQQRKGTCRDDKENFKKSPKEDVMVTSYAIYLEWCLVASVVGIRTTSAYPTSMRLKGHRGTFPLASISAAWRSFCPLDSDCLTIS